MNKKYGAFSSSTNPQELADTVKGLILTFSSLIIFGANYLGFEIGSAEITQFAIVISGAIGSMWTLYGLLKKIVVAFSAKY